jgi:hypothetical protein
MDSPPCQHPYFGVDFNDHAVGVLHVHCLFCNTHGRQTHEMAEDGTPPTWNGESQNVEPATTHESTE